MSDALKEIEAEVLAHKPEFQRLAGHLTALGPPAVGELLSELEVDFDIDDVVMARLERYARLDRTALRIVGAETFPALPLQSVS